MRTIEIVAKNLKFYRQQRGLTQEELASKACNQRVLPQQVERWSPTVDRIARQHCHGAGAFSGGALPDRRGGHPPEQYDEFRHLRGISSTMEPWRKSLFLRVVSSTLNALRDWKPVEEPEKTEQE